MTLRLWRGKTLAERTVLFNEKFSPLKISTTTLRRTYIKLGVKKKKILETKTAPARSLEYINR